jgi:Fe-S-cluster containining protein
MQAENMSHENRKPERRDADHALQFDCSPGVPCFTECCRDVTIALTPYDVLRMKRALGISSDEFLEKYTIIVPKKDQLIPLVVLKMNEDDKKCPFVTPEGCRIYSDRPWPCRMFPLNMNDDGTFSLITDESRCSGLKANETNRISDWLVQQGVHVYDEMNDLFAQITSPLRAQPPDIDNPKIYQMTFMALYNLDKFRKFVLNSTFLDRFKVDPLVVEKINRSDIELLKFAFDWIKFGIFGQKTFQVRPEAVPESDPPR